MIRVNLGRPLAWLGVVISIPVFAAGCAKKLPPPPMEDADASAPAPTPSITDLAPLTDTGDAGDAAAEASAKKWTGPAVSPNQAKISACCAAMRAEAKQLGPSSPEAFQITALAAQCDVFAKQVGPLGTAPELAQLRQVLKSVKLPSACQF
jgi:hypothetical protein